MKLQTKKFGRDFYNYDVGVGFPKAYGNRHDERGLKRHLKDMLASARRNESKEIIMRELSESY